MNVRVDQTRDNQFLFQVDDFRLLSDERLYFCVGAHPKDTVPRYGHGLGPGELLTHRDDISIP
jgi:hypothetical protein